MNTETIDPQTGEVLTVADKAPEQNLPQLQPSRLPIVSSIAKEYDLQPADWRVLVDQTFPNAQTVEAILMALTYCRARNLDIFKKPVHIVPMWSTALRRYVETVWPGISEIRTTAARTGEYAGLDAVEFGPMVERTFKGKIKQDGKWKDTDKTIRYPEWASRVVYRFVKGHKCAFPAIVYWEEAYATIGKSEIPNDMWSRRTRGQLDKCVEAAALRMAFPEEVGSMYAAEEMEGRVIDHASHESVEIPVSPEPPAPVDIPAPAEEPEKPQETAAEQPEEPAQEQTAPSEPDAPPAPAEEPPAPEEPSVIEGEIIPPEDDDTFPGDRPSQMAPKEKPQPEPKEDIFDEDLNLQDYERDVKRDMAEIKSLEDLRIFYTEKVKVTLEDYPDTVRQHFQNIFETNATRIATGG